MFTKSTCYQKSKVIKRFFRYQFYNIKAYAVALFTLEISGHIDRVLKSLSSDVSAAAGRNNRTIWLASLSDRNRARSTIPENFSV